MAERANKTHAFFSFIVRMLYDLPSPPHTEADYQCSKLDAEQRALACEFSHMWSDFCHHTNKPDTLPPKDDVHELGSCARPARPHSLTVL